MPRRLVITIAVSLALVLGACGDDGGSGDAETAQTSESADASADGDVSPDDVSAFFSGDCRDAIAAFQSALASVGGAFTPGGDTAGAEQTAALLSEIADEAPDEVADDFVVLADAYAEFARALADAGVDFEDPSTFQDPDALAALSSVGEAFDDAEVTEAADNIEAWFDANCGVE